MIQLHKTQFFHFSQIMNKKKKNSVVPHYLTQIFRSSQISEFQPTLKFPKNPWSKFNQLPSKFPSFFSKWMKIIARKKEKKTKYPKNILPKISQFLNL